jgi:hypothetical protein
MSFAKNLSFLSHGSTNVLSRSRLSAQTQEAFDAAQAIIKANANAGDIKIDCWVFDHMQHGVAYSALVFMGTDISPASLNSKIRTSGVLLIEGSAEPKTPLMIQFNNRPIEVPRGPADAIDATFQMKVDRFVESKLSILDDGITTVGINPMVAPRDFNFKDEAACYTLLTSMLQAMHSPIIQGRSDYVPINLSQLVSEEAINMSLTFGQDSLTGADGHPFRSDIIVDTSIVKRQQGTNKTGMNEGDSFRLARATGYMDLIYSPATPQQQFGQMGFGMVPQDTRKFTGRFIMTSMDNYYATDIPAMLMNIVGVLALQSSSLWRVALLPRPQMGARRIDMRNIGALNIEGNLPNVPGYEQGGYGAPIDTGAGWSVADADMFMSSLIRQEIAISMVIGRHTAEGWGNAVWAEAARGDANAIQEILAGADILTGGNFSRMYNSTANPVQMTADSTGTLQDCMLAGFYIDTEGQKRSVHDFDYLAMANVAGIQDPSALARWSNARTYSTSKPVHVRLEEQRRLIQDKFHFPVTFTGVDRMVNLMPDFLRALLGAVQSMGVAISLQSQNPFADNVGGRVQFDGLQSLLYSQNQAGSNPFNIGGAGQGNAPYRNQFGGAQY